MNMAMRRIYHPKCICKILRGKRSMAHVNNIKEVTEPLKEEILNGNVHTIVEMRARLFLGYAK